MKPTKYDLTQAQLRAQYVYFPETGVFCRPLKNGINKPLGTPTNVLTGNPYLKTVIDLVQYPVHRLIWIYMHGSPPIGRLLHIDGDGYNNRIENLVDQGAITVRNPQNPTKPQWCNTKKKWVVKKGEEVFEYRNRILANRKAEEATV